MDQDYQEEDQPQPLAETENIQENNAENEKRATRSSKHQKKGDESQTLRKESERDFFVIPQSKSQACLSKELMVKILDQCQLKSERLVREKQREIELSINLAIYYQL